MAASDLNALSGLAVELASTFVALSSDIALVIDGEGAIRSVVQGAAPLSPAANEWVGRAWVDTVTGDTRRKIEQLLSDVQTIGVARQREVNLPSQEGENIPVAYAAIRLGEHGPVLAVGRDLRAIAAIQQRFAESQQEMERDYWKRRQSELRYRALFQVATDAVLVVDALTMSIVEANPAAAQLFTLSLEQLAGKHATVGIDRHSWPAVEELLASARATGRAAEVRARLASGAGAIDISATPFRSERDLLLLVRARTVVQRAATSDSSTAESEKWADLVQRMPDAVVLADSRGRVLAANPAFLELCQLPASGQCDGGELSQCLGSATVSSLLRLAKSHGIATQPGLLRGHDGRLAEVSVSAALLDDGDSESVGFSFRTLDVRDTKPAPAVEEISLAIDALTGLMGRKSLPELLQSASSLAERHLIKSALARAAGDAHTAALLLDISVHDLAERVRFHALAASPAGGNAPAPS